MTRVLVVLMVTSLFLASCGSNNKKDDCAPTDSIDVEVPADSVEQKDIEEDAVPTAADELFDDFIFNFAANKKMQKSRIHFPLSETRGQKVQKIDVNNWKMDYFFMLQGYYTLLLDNDSQIESVKNTTINHAIVEKIYFNTKSIKQYVFNRTKGLWMLDRIQYIPIEQSHNASFLDFYQKFASDSDFQVRSLNEAVQFVGPDPDDDFNMMEGIVTADTWPAFAPQLPKKIIYNIIYGQPQQEKNEKVFLLRGIANGLEMQLTFKRKGNKWKLMKMTT